MTTNFTSLEIHNFLSIGHAEIDLRNRGYVLVNGINRNAEDNALSNGSGKSSLWDALCWCITGQTMRGSKTDVKNIRANDGDGVYVKLCFSVDNDDYEVIRAKNHSVYKSSVILKVNGVDCSGSGVRDGGKVLADRLPDITYNLLTSVILLAQGLPNRFSSNTPSGRKEVIETLSKSDYMIEDIKKRISERADTLSRMLTSENEKRIKFSTEKDVLSNSIVRLNEDLINLGDVSELEEELKSVNRAIDTTTTALSALQSAYDKEVEDYNTVNDKSMQAVSAVRSKYEPIISDLRNSLSTVDGEIAYNKAQVNLLMSQINNAKTKVRTFCPTCKRPFDGIVIPDTSAEEEEVKKLEAIIAELSVKQSNISAEINTDTIAMQYDISVEESNYRDTLRDAQSTISSLNNQIKDANDLLMKHKISAERLSTTIESHETRVREINAQISDTSRKVEELSTLVEESENKINKINESVAVVKKFSTSASRDFRGYLISGIIEYINTKAEEYAVDVYGSRCVKVKMDKNNIDIVYNDRLYENLSGGEKQKVDIIVQLALRDMMCNYVGFSSNIIVLDEIFDNLDSVGCEKIIDLLSYRLADVSSIFIITHHTDIDIPYDGIITMIKDANGISSVM